MEEKIVISASRTRDLVRCAPGLLAQFVSGARPVRFVRTPALHALSPGRIGALALWTKDPAPLLSHAALGDVLASYRNEHAGAVLLNLTVTGLGGTALEPGIPPHDSILKSTGALIDSGLIEPEAVILRYDPLIAVRTADGPLRNIDIGLFTGIARGFRRLGVERIKVSAVDYGYAHVSRRLARHGIEPRECDANAACAFVDEMNRVCAEMGMRVDVCCNPAARTNETTAGCIDGTLINAILEKRGAAHRVSIRPHNEIGRQRPGCRCTWSTDIGYSPGIPGCFTSDGACLYCYSQRNARANLSGRSGANEIPAERPL